MSEISINIRRGDESDAKALSAFAARVFEESYAADNNPEDMALYINSKYGVKRQRAELKNQDILTLLVEYDGELAGYAQVWRHSPPGCIADKSSLELWRFYIDKPWHGKGIAQILMDAVKDSAMELGGESIWLSVWQENPRAVAFYEKCGFTIVGSQEFPVGNDRQMDHIMTTRLSK